MKAMGLRLHPQWGSVLRRQILTLSCSATMLMLCRRQEAMATADNDSFGVGMTIIAAFFCQPALSAPRAETVRVHLHESDPAPRHDHHPAGNEHRLDGRVLFARGDWTRSPRYLEQALALRSFISATVGVPWAIQLHRAMASGRSWARTDTDVSVPKTDTS